MVTVTRETTTGVWCDKCFLPAGSAVTVYVDASPVATLEGCGDCRTGIYSILPDAGSYDD